MPCGLIGVLTLDGTAPPVDHVQRGADALRHRGPDGHGVYVDAPLALGHRRLAIIDTVTGAQPMVWNHGELCIAFNGEIYNYKELRRELEARHGLTFSTQSDTEVILGAYAAWGLEVLQRLVGMFAFALWDRARQRLLLAVDHLAQKQLCYRVHPGRQLWFASEIKGLLAADPGAVLDHDSLVLYAMLNYVPLPGSLVAGARRIPPGHYLLVDLKAPSFSPMSYWRLPEPPPPDGACGDRATVAAELERLLRESVRVCLRSDVPLGCFLSGGLDSATVAAIAAQESGALRVFTAGFAGLPDERPIAREVARHIGATHVEIVLEPCLERDLARFAWMLDEPIGDTSIVPSYYICQAAREHTTVCLGGDGGDELLAGYGHYREHLGIEQPARTARLSWGRLATQGWEHLPGRLRGLLAPVATAVRPLLRRNLARAITSPARRHLSLVSHHYAGGLGAWLQPDLAARLPVWDRFLGDWPEESALDTAARFDLTVNLPGVLLRKMDLASMAVALEVRSPLLDHRLVEFSRRLAWSLKTDRVRGKLLLRDLASRWLPPIVFEQPKMGFGAPMEQWLRSPRMEQEVRARLLDTGEHSLGRLVRTAALEALVTDFYERRVPQAQKVWTWLVLAQWLREYNVGL